MRVEDLFAELAATFEQAIQIMELRAELSALRAVPPEPRGGTNGDMNGQG